MLYQRIFLVLVAASIFASAALSAEPPKVPADLGHISFLLGDWTCTGAASRDPANYRPGPPATVHARKAVGSHWIQLSYDNRDLHVAGYIGFNTKRKQFVQSMVDSYGDYWLGSSGGWNGDTLTFDDSSAKEGNPSSYRDSYVKHGADEFVHVGEVQRNGKKWVKIDEQTCRRTK
ncbi:MAG: DUF1579 family protein [Steroidobacteraceae bacterium]